MSRVLAHLLLALSLLLSGLLPFSAHAGHAPGHAHAAGGLHGAHASHHGQSADAAAGMDCSADTDCDCGCALPHVLPMALAWLDALVVKPVPATRVPVLIGIQRDRPPLRPPAA